MESNIARCSRAKMSFSYIVILGAIAILFSVSGNVLAAEATPTTITIHWTSPGDDGLDGTASEYDIRYSTSAITGANWDAATQATGEPSPQAAGQAESFTITGLTPSTNYYIAVKAADEVPNWSALSNVIMVSTLAEDTAPERITTFAVTGNTSTSVSLSWTAPGDDGAVGTATTYDIRYSTSLITSANFNAATAVTGEPSPQAAGNLESFTVTGLNPSTQYYFAIKAADEVPNWNTMSNVVSTTTGSEQTAPAIIANLAVGTITGSSIVLTWTAPGDDGSTGTASEYDIRYSTSPITDLNFNSATQVSGEPSPQAAGSSESYTVTGLDSDTQYYFAIKTADEVPNWSGLSNVVTATTPDITPPATIMDLTYLLDMTQPEFLDNALPVLSLNHKAVVDRKETDAIISLSGQLSA
ncbi:MAG: fibronectin type III domain-containing protein [Candidatus Zixiibacteriota bacterium]